MQTIRKFISTLSPDASSGMPHVSSDEEALGGVSDLSFQSLNPLALQLMMDSRRQTERKNNQRESEKPKPRKHSPLLQRWAK
jgi:hypothetical protein